MIARIRYLQSGNVEYYINGQLVTRDEYDAAVPSKLEGLFDGARRRMRIRFGLVDRGNRTR